MTSTKKSRAAQILLVEDNIDDVELTLEAFEEATVPVQAHVAPDGITALAFLRREPGYDDKPRPDIVLLDLNLPSLSGHEVLHQIRRDPELTDLPVVVLTTSEDPRDIQAAYQSHANCYITKPVDFLQFADIIKQIERFWLQLVSLPSKG